MADTAVAEQVDSGSTTEWGKMTLEQREADIDKGFAEMQAEKSPDSVAEAEEAETTEQTTKETPAAGDETPAGDDAAPAEDTAAGEGEEEEAVETEWLDQDLQDLATTMGLSDEDLAGFGSREELERALRIIDRKAFEAGKAPPVQQQAQVAAPQQQVQQTGQQASQQKQSLDSDPFGDLTQFKLGEEFDETAAKPINRFVETAAPRLAKVDGMDARLARIEQHLNQQSVGDIRRQAIESIRSLGHTELFGKPGETPTKVQVANLEKALDAHFIHARGLLAMGRNVSPTPAFLKAAVHLAFGDQLTKQERQQLTEKLRKQSARRTGGGTSKPLPKPKGTQTKLEELLSDPELDKKFNDLVSERKG